MHISLTELRRTPKPALDHVRDGEEVVVTDAGVPLCRIVPIGKSTKYAELVAQGVIRPPREPVSPSVIRAEALKGWKAPQ